MEKIVITGGLGNLGSAIARELVRNGHQVIIYDYREDENSVKDFIDQIQVVHNDIRDFDRLRRVMIGVSGVIHLAAVSRVVWGYENPHECVDINIRGTANVLEAARISVRKPWIVFGSSREVYGEPEILPCKESDPKKIANIYGATKIAGENLLEQYHRNYGLSGLTIRFSNVYGSMYDQLDRVIPKFMIRASKNLPLVIQGGNQVFDFTHIDDVIQGLLAGIDLLIKRAAEDIPYYNDFHFVTGKATSLQELTDYINNIFIKPVTIEYASKRDYDVEKFYGNPEKSERILGFKTQIDIETGIKLLAEELTIHLNSKNKLKF